MGQVLVAKYGQQPWILQIMEAVMGAVDRGINQLSGSAGPQQNAMAGDIKSQGYALPARTKEEILAENPNLLNTPATQQAPVADMFAMLGQGVATEQQLGQSLPNQPAPQPMQETPATASGLVLPHGVEQPAPPPPANNQEWPL